MATLLTPLSRTQKQARGERQWTLRDKAEPAGKRFRTAGQRDRDRVLYSAALHRLAYVTQVTAPEAGYIFHNRLTHSLKVAQVGRRNAERLLQLVKEKKITGAAASLVRAIDVDAIEASCLAHDLGHPPFGHIAEQALNECGEKYLKDPFEGNAQSFRIVTQLAVRSANPGLDLTGQTLNGLLKYPWKRWSPDPLPGGKRKRKWGYYAEDKEAYDFVRKGWAADSKDQIAQRCLEAEIMDWADDLTYAVHDVDDFFRAGLIPLDRLVDKKDNELKRLAELLESARVEDPASFPNMAVEELVEAAREAISRHRLPPRPYEHTKASRAAMRQFGSQLITDYLEDFTLGDHLSSGKVELKIGERAKREVEALKMLAVVYVIRRPSLAVVQEGQKRVVMSLFERYYEASGSDEKSKDGIRLFPPGAREKLRMEGGDSRARIVMDLISGLTETAAIELHNRLSGGWTASALDATATIG